MIYSSLPGLRGRIALLKQEGCATVFSNGCFDPLRAKHIRMFHIGMDYFSELFGPQFVKLLVAVNGDDSAARLKGAGRPLFYIAERMDIIDSLGIVDMVVSFGDDTPERLIADLKPDYLLKGGDYKPTQVAGHTHVKDVHIVPTRDAWRVPTVKPPSINEVIARSVGDMVRAQEHARDYKKLYEEKHA